MEITNRTIDKRKDVVLPEAVRAGWSEAAAEVAAKGEDEPLMGEFGNADVAEVNASTSGDCRCA